MTHRIGTKPIGDQALWCFIFFFFFAFVFSLTIDMIYDNNSNSNNNSRQYAGGNDTAGRRTTVHNNDDGDNDDDIDHAVSTKAAQFVWDYPLHLRFPAIVQSVTARATTTTTTSTTAAAAAAAPPPSPPPHRPIRTNVDFIQHRLVEHGMIYHDEHYPTHRALAAAQATIHDLQRTNCFRSIQIEFDTAADSDNHNHNNNKATTTTISSDVDKNHANHHPSPPLSLPIQPPHTVHVTLDEAPWYKIHVGGGLKTSGVDDHGLGGVGSSGGGGTSVISNLSNATAATTNANHSVAGIPLPTTTIDASVGLRNLSGYCDQTEIRYSIDSDPTTFLSAAAAGTAAAAASSSSNSTTGVWTFYHERPLYSMFPHSLLSDYILQQERGSQYSISTQATISNLVNFESSRGYREYQRQASIRLSNQHSTMASNTAATVPGIYWGWEGLYTHRDIIPRRIVQSPRHATTTTITSPSPSSSFISPFGTIVSSPVITQYAACPNEKLSIVHEFRTNDAYVDSTTNPTNGIMVSSRTELASSTLSSTALSSLSSSLTHDQYQPISSTVFLKNQSTCSIHTPLNDHLSLHGAASLGFITTLGNIVSGTSSQSVSTSTAINPIHPSDRFYIGGPMQLRGFLPNGGIGPRAIMPTNSIVKSGSITPNGDALGGNLYYTATGMISYVPPLFHTILNPYGIRFIAYGNVGTCVQVTAGSSSSSSSTTTSTTTPPSSIVQILNSTRAAVGIGMTTNFFGPRTEVTYSWPLRYSPRDARRQLQLGISFDFQQ
jgi:hypothetical protein